MSTDPKSSVSSEEISESTKTQIQTLMASGLADFSLRELLGTLLSGVSVAERDLHLEHRPEDRPNGFYDRSLQVGSVPVDIRVPRTRNGDFRPANLPSPYQRGYPEEVESLLLKVIAPSIRHPLSCTPWLPKPWKSPPAFARRALNQSTPTSPSVDSHIPGP